ncbi:protein tyrosine phosphatase type IVA 3-like [Denticeps clupeoides]|uniref:protein tyrosine phosphatase type IVA 3-like n=1 Tax=Denticeps clupeoides TaxID=299321 RepID=UPI0010A40670|nr:protein tyrosine phosphatase type IVA 3-like [Denticeps clupeoides]
MRLRFRGAAWGEFCSHTNKNPLTWRNLHLPYEFNCVCVCLSLSLSLSLSPCQDWPFDDGAPPPSKVVEDWLSLLKSRFLEEPGCCVAVHCVAGLGRAPVLVALALIESGMKYEDAIQFIRQKRRGAINSKQLTYLEKYRPKQRLRYKHPHIFKNKCCVM